MTVLNVNKHLQICNAKHLRRPECSATQLWEFRISHRDIFLWRQLRRDAMTQLVSQGELIAFTSDPEGNINEGVNSTSFIPLALIITTTHINGCNNDKLL